MLRGEKILITGPAGRIANGIAKTLAPNNEVWGIARFSDPAAAPRSRRSVSPPARSTWAIASGRRR